MKFWIGIVLCLLGIGCLIFAAVWQQVLCYQMFGFIFKELIIPHWSAWFYLGIIPLCVGYAVAVTD